MARRPILWLLAVLALLSGGWLVYDSRRVATPPVAPQPEVMSGEPASPPAAPPSATGDGAGETQTAAPAPTAVPEALRESTSPAAGEPATAPAPPPAAAEDDRARPAAGERADAAAGREGAPAAAGEPVGAPGAPPAAVASERADPSPAAEERPAAPPATTVTERVSGAPAPADEDAAADPSPPSAAPPATAAREAPEEAAPAAAPAPPRQVTTATPAGSAEAPAEGSPATPEEPLPRESAAGTAAPDAGEAERPLAAFQEWLRLGTIEPGAGLGERPPAAQPQGQAQESQAPTADTYREPATVEAAPERPPERPVAGAASDEEQRAAALEGPSGASMPATGEPAPAREAPAETPAATATGAPEGAAGMAPAPPASSLMVDSIRRALAAVLGGPPPVPESVPRERAQQPPEPAPSLTEPERARPETAAPAEGPVGPVRPSFDIVRVERDGRAVLAGRAAPGAEVELRSGEKVLDRVTASQRGEWVSTPAQPLAPGGHELTLAARGSAGAPLLTAEQVLVVALPEPPPPQPAATALAGPPPPQPPELAKGGPPPPQPAEVALAGADPVAMLLSREKPGAGRILQAPGRISGDGKLALLVLDYDDAGQIRLSGEAPPGAPVRIYVDNQPSAEVTVEPSGKWTTLLDRELAPGDYTLRLDQLGSDGVPVARLETPFTRVRQPPVAGQAQVDYVIVQPGNSLWRIARRLFGQGFKYVHIYDANQAQIRDPDLIYPGQVFEVPAALGTAG